jgi:hypothetical protein
LTVNRNRKEQAPGKIYVFSALQYVNLTQAREDFSSRFHLPCPFSCDSCHSPVRHRLGDGGWANLPVLLVSALVAPKRSGGGLPLSAFVLNPTFPPSQPDPG